MQITYLAVILVSASTATAHYTIPVLNGNPEWTVVRKAKNYLNNGFVSDLTSNDLRCNQLAAGTNTLTVAAGAKVTVTANNDFYHPGPFQSYLARVPDGQDINTWDSTDAVWFKIYQDAFEGGQKWANSGLSSVTVPLPSCLAAGSYLMRNEQIGLHVASTKGGAQFYLSCGQLQVTNSGTNKTPAAANLVAFPGAYKDTDPGILININYPTLTSYTNPGPAVFTC